MNKSNHDCLLDLKESKAYIASTCVKSCPIASFCTADDSRSSSTSASERVEFEKLYDKMFARPELNLLDFNFGNLKNKGKEDNKNKGKEEFVKLMEDRAALLTERNQFRDKLKQTARKLRGCTDRKRLDDQSKADAEFAEKKNAKEAEAENETDADAVLNAHDKSILLQIQEADALREVLLESLHKKSTSVID